MASAQVTTNAHTARTPLLLSALLLLLIACALYILYTRNTTATQQYIAQELAAEHTRSAQLEAQKKQLESWMKQDPCTVRDALRKAQVP